MTLCRLLSLAFSLIFFLPIDIYAIDFKDIGPGGGGQILEFYVKGNTIIAGTDVGGVFLSEDGGKSFKNKSIGLTSVKINSLDVTGNTIYAGTSDGVFKSTDKGETWVIKNNGLEEASHTFTHPIQSIKIDPSNTNILWAAIGQPDSEEFRNQDPYVLYKSTDAASTWVPVLNIPMSDVDEDLGSLLAQIKIHPDDSNKVWFATSRGFYYTLNGGTSFYELGIKKAKISKDYGATWKTCSTTNTDCELEFRTSTKLCTEGSTCLPVVDSIGETHANVSDVDVSIDPSDSSKVTMYATIRDLGYSVCTGTRMDDRDLTWFKGGPYKSTDNGKTWERIFEAEDGTNLSAAIRCGVTSSLSFTSVIYNHVRADPDDPDHFIVSAEQHNGGIYEYRKKSDGKTTWVYWSDDAYCGEDQVCFEGARSQGLWSTQNGPSINTFLVSDWSENRPIVYLSHSRGLIKGSFNHNQNKVTYDQVDSDEASEESYWGSNGLSDYCARDMVIYEDHLLVVGSDSSPLTGKIEGSAYVWKSGSAELAFDESRVVLADEEGNKVYTNRYKTTDSSSNSILTSSDEGKTWSLIGGDCGEITCDTDYGLPDDIRVHALGLDTSSSKTKRKILAGTEKGLYFYNPSTTSDEKWAFVDKAGCPTEKSSIHKILTVSEKTGVLLLSADSSGASPSEDGIYYVKINSGSITCSHLEGGETLYDPTELALTQLDDESYVLLTVAIKSSKSSIYRTTFNFSNPTSVSWQQTFSISKAEGLAGFSETENFKKKDFSTLAIDPTQPNIVLVGMVADPYFDGYVPSHFYVSFDYGQTFEIFDDFNKFPIKNIDFFKFSSDGATLYAAPRCGSLYAMDNPFLEEEGTSGSDTSSSGGGSSSSDAGGSSGSSDSSDTSGAGGDSGSATGDENTPPPSAGCSFRL